MRAKLFLLAGLAPSAARNAELGMRAVVCGDTPLVAEGEPLLAVDPPSLLISALKPAEAGDGIVLRLSNPTGAVQEACVTLGFPFERVESLRLDEEPADYPVSREGATLRFSVPPHALRTLGIS